MTSSEIIKFLILRTIGNFLVLFALFGVGATFGPALYLEVSYRLMTAKGVTYKVITSRSVQNKQVFQSNVNVEPGFSTILSDAKSRVLTPKDTLFDVVIPKIGANAQVFPNIDPTNEQEYVNALKKGVAHAKGTVFPGMQGSIYLFAHSTDNFWDVGRYNAVFYLLKDLTIGDDVTLFFQNKRYNYTVTNTKIIDGNDVSYLVDAQHTHKEQVILQTCWPPGTTWKRLLVIAEPAK
ncbi:MAG TPA: sortase [Candidatus Saccharimonadales bacterium]|nr:sortase [Candidatus Saccharimonadales bacterium]